MFFKQQKFDTRITMKMINKMNHKILETFSNFKNSESF